MERVGEMNRPYIAFLVAALAVPIFVAVAGYSPGVSNDIGYGVTVSVSAIISFNAVFFLGVPIYSFLLARKWTAFWIAPLVGFIVATVVWCVVLILFGLALSNGRLDVLSNLTAIGLLRALVWPIGPIGAAVGALLWLIARPDRSQG
jgi:hypothetical protein